MDCGKDPLFSFVDIAPRPVLLELNVVGEGTKSVENDMAKYRIVNNFFIVDWQRFQGLYEGTPFIDSGCAWIHFIDPILNRKTSESSVL